MLQTKAEESSLPDNTRKYSFLASILSVLSSPASMNSGAEEIGHFSLQEELARELPSVVELTGQDEEMQVHLGGICVWW